MNLKKIQKVPFFVPWITYEDRLAINKALCSTLLTAGPILAKFEFEFAKFTGARYAIGVSNATAALHLALKAIGIHHGDEVIIPDMTFVATASAVFHNGAIPVLADVKKNDLNIFVDSIKKKITSRTKAILPVHFAGKICDIKIIKEIADRNNLAIIEDCAHAIGARLGHKHVGTFGDIGCFSFYPTKNITTIEGGMVITNSKKVAEYIRMARNHGITKSLLQRYSKGKPWDYDVIEPGYNYRLDEIRSALGISQLKKISKLNWLRKKACQYYNSKLKSVKGIETPTLSSSDDNVYHLYIIRVKDDYHVSREKLFNKLLKNGITSTVHYKPLHKFTVFNKLKNSISGLKNSSEVYREIISLPLYPQISRFAQDKVIKCIKN